MLHKSQPILAVEHDFQILCQALENTSEEKRLLLLAKLALVLCDCIEDKQLVQTAIQRATLNCS